MKIKLPFIILVCGVFYSANLGALSLVDEAKQSGLASLPKNQKEVDDILKQNGVKASPFSIEKSELGKKLYFDPRLSKSSIISCNTCHNLGLGGTDGVSTAIGHRWTANPHHLNSPTVYNSVLNTTQFWDGRAKTLADQAKGPIESEAEMATPSKLAVEKISSLPEYVEEFKKIYGKSGVNFDNIADAIANFERTLITPSRFDKFLDGDENALNDKEKKGLKLFLDKGCVACHTGVNLGGSMQPFQVAAKYKFADIGDFKGDANGMVKTPTLRNIAETAPYFHNGAIWSLQDAIKEMGSVQLGIKITDQEAKSIEMFLHSLTGEKPKITYPQFPVSTGKTPKPQL
ncbi:cytochrome C biogenesis protein CcsA [Campylobacter novaezeelandiae]|uniref:Cytochrome C biogenesis protein CcsA n=1 Tax=Campylobacter novaezeelandiae TaxID=2267891 RepID=A0A4V2JQL8_9BACT|nr:cytochrome-c peroxidase [Campylobacter novaezeelandiae]MBK1963916.1 cytochrome-c peroxidase [Campylobacter novaezeelandiae]MBK1992929.1 cytochrome-c peroxidase [Campylobacter novaezeelandiae]QWU80622.1 periplasmic diheme cytochrome c peroxidase [Campylobacter novaezeelandiae]TBR78336.1 cytochrome C biogenesis protein CcsA [Campylobacter novaezeelandiae]TBR79867.1 cytochrome C biogenesis protein CcsA [Campylobacter novaezeelandiae]